MDATRRYWAVASIACFLAGSAAAFGQSLLLVSAAGLGAWLIAAQYSFVRGVAHVSRSIVVEQTVSPTQGRTGETYHLTVTARTPDQCPLSLSFRPSPPSTARYSDGTDDPTCELQAGERNASMVTAVEFPVAGTPTFDPPTVTAEDRFGLFSERFERGSSASVTVDPALPDDVHVGKGGMMSAARGQYRHGPQSTGYDLKDIREYVTSDPVRRINWRLTARLRSPHVVEYEPEADVKRVLVFDHRPTMAVGTPGRSKLDYNREVALAFVENAEAESVPLGLYTFGQDSVATVIDPSTTQRRFRKVRTHLLAQQSTETQTRRRRTPIAPSLGREQTVRTANHLRNDTSAFATTVRPFLAASASFAVRLAEEPLFSTVNTALNRVSGTLSFVIFTDDSEPETLRETIRAIRREQHYVSVFVTPTALFEWEERADLDRLAEQYRSFESLRRDLDSQQRVEAFEVAPRERIEVVRTVLERQDGPTETASPSRDGDPLPQ